MSDIVERLRATNPNTNFGSTICAGDAWKAADEITALRARIEQLEASIADAEEKAHDIGLADGRAAAIQEIDVATGGDGEYRFCTDHDPDRHTPDPDTMKARIVERFATLKASKDSADGMHDDIWNAGYQAAMAKVADEREDAAQLEVILEEWMFLYHWKAEGMNVEQARIHAKTQLKIAKQYRSRQP